ncbi:MAG: hypothetical protein Q9195_003964 [Heterodermia aff. obscurata]
MDSIDRDLEKAEDDASPSRFPVAKPENDQLQRTESTSSGSSSSSSASSIVREEMRMSRVNTQRDLERHPTALSRIETQRSQHSATVGRSLKSRESKRPLPAFGAGKAYPPQLPGQEEYVVEFDGPDDPLHPQNWPMKRKVFLSVILGYTTLVSAFASSLFSAATAQVAFVFGVSTEVGLLGLSLYVLGFATGPILWAPLSELRGRKLPLLVAMFGFTIFQIAVAVGKDLQTVLICRFFGGVFGSCPLAVVAAIFSDETYPPVVLVEKASELRRRTSNWGIHAKQEEIEVDLRELITKNFSRPLRLLFTEPIVLLLSIYMAFIYGLLYLFFTAYPIVFQRIHGMNPGVGGLPFFGQVLGMLLAGVYIALTQPSYNKKLEANNGIPVPEWRLPPVIVGGVTFALGIFWFAWSGYRRDIHWIAPTLSVVFYRYGHRIRARSKFAPTLPKPQAAGETSSED